MTLTEYRKSQGLTLEAMAERLGKSKGHLSGIEQNNRASAKLALAIERETQGLVNAASLNDEIAEARQAAA